MSDADLAPRRREAGHFLRSRRERLSPAAVGLPPGERRRTPGLRREEVALLAGVGTTWYAWLEQGRDVRPSSTTLGALARALRLDEAERRHLFGLHGQPIGERAHPDSEKVGEALVRTLDSLTGQPAYVLGRRWDILAWNRAADVVFGPYGSLERDQRNALHLLFADPDHRRLLIDWEIIARSTLAMFRADCARHAGDADFERLVEDLTNHSPEFARWWREHEVTTPLAGRKRIEHPHTGRMLFEFSSFDVPDATSQKLIVFTPMPEEDSISKLLRLLAQPQASPKA